jgi:hypothetical protein
MDGVASFCFKLFPGSAGGPPATRKLVDLNNYFSAS